jgi:hypothetical protein
MKKLIYLLIMLTLMVSTNFAQNYGIGNTNPAVFTKYRIPETILSVTQLNSNLSYSSTNNTQSDLGTGYYPSRANFNSNLNYELTPKYQYLNERDDQKITFTAKLDGIYNYYGQKNSNDIYESYNKRININFEASSEYNKYFGQDNLFFNLASSAYVTIDELYSNPYNSTVEVYSSNKVQNYTLRLGFGWGKIRNVTPVVSAIRFQERLKQLNLINNDLSGNAINDLAQQFSKEDYYGLVHDRPGKYFWQDVEDVLVKHNLSSNSLNEYSRQFLQETPYEIRFLRKEGIEAMLDLRFEYDNIYTSETSLISENLSPQLYGFLEFDHQLNLNSQLRAYVSLSGGPNLSEHSLTNQTYDCLLSINYDYELTNRFVMSIGNSLSQVFTNRKHALPQIKSLVYNLSVSCDYFIEDQISLTTRYTFNYNGTNYQYVKTSGVNNNLSIGITYFIDRGFILK